MPRRRAVVTETVNGSPGMGWQQGDKDTAGQDVDTSSPETPVSRRSSSTSGKGPSLRRSLTRTLSSLFRSSSTSSTPPTSPKQQPVSPDQPSSEQHTPSLLVNGSEARAPQTPEPSIEQQQRKSASLQRPPIPSSATPPCQQTPEPFSRRQPLTDEMPPAQEGSSTLPRHYQKRQQSVEGKAPSRMSRLKAPPQDPDNKSASCTRISDMPPDDDEEEYRPPVHSVANVADAASADDNPRLRWSSVVNAAKRRSQDRNDRRTDSWSRLRFSSTFIRKSVGDDLGSPISPGLEDNAFFNDEVDASLDSSHAIIRHKPKGRAMKRTPSRVERKDAYLGRPPSGTLSASTGTLTRLSRKAPTANFCDL